MSTSDDDLHRAALAEPLARLGELGARYQDFLNTLGNAAPLADDVRARLTQAVHTLEDADITELAQRLGPEAAIRALTAAAMGDANARMLGVLQSLNLAPNNREDSP